MGIGEVLSRGLNTVSFGTVGHRDPEVVSFIVHADGTKSEEPSFKEHVQYRRDQSLSVATGTLGVLGGVAAIEGVRNMAMGAARGTWMNSLLGSTAALVGMRAVQGLAIGAVGLGTLGVLQALTDQDVPLMGFATDRMKTPTVKQVYYDEYGNNLGSEIVDRATYEMEKTAAEYWAS